MKYRCRVARLRIEVTELEIDFADNDVGSHPEATHKAVSALAEDTAEDLPNAVWDDGTELFFDEYRPWTFQVLSEEELPEDEEEKMADFNDDRDLDEMIADEPLCYKKYLLLEADTFAGEGRLIPQPWFNADRPDLMENDLIGDWLYDLEAIQERYGKD